MNDETIDFAIVGAGWRSDFFLHIAAATPNIRVCGVVVRNTARAEEVESQWHVDCYADIETLKKHCNPAFVVACVSASSMASVCLDLASRKIPVLAETPPAIDLSSLITLYESMQRLGARIQVAEQYWAQPMHAARIETAASGLLGEISEARVSVCHGYHGMSLIRRMLGVKFESANIRGIRFPSEVVAGPDRGGPPESETISHVETDFAWLDFAGKLGVFDFTLPQYRNWIRGQRVCVRGSRGEIVDERVTYLQDATTPIQGEYVRHEAGRRGNLEGMHLKGVQLFGEWCYRNPLIPARLSDEEVAVGHCLLAMQKFVETGEEFYSLAEACQDQYLALACEEAIVSGNVIETRPQIWGNR